MIARPTTPAPQTWNGKGLPPVGTDCETAWDSDFGTYAQCKVLAHDGARAVFQYTSGPRAWEYQAEPQCMFGPQQDTPQFRPSRHPEQLAAEARKQAIAQMVATCPYPGSASTKIDCETLYDAGYRKITEG